MYLLEASEITSNHVDHSNTEHKTRNMVNTPAIPAKTRIVSTCLKLTNIFLLINFTKKMHFCQKITDRQPYLINI